MCKFCEKYDFGMVGYRLDGDRGMVYFPSHAGNIPSEERFKFCPSCGRALSPDAKPDSSEKLDLQCIDRKEKTVEGTRYARDTYTIGPYTVEVDYTYYEDGTSRRSIGVTEPWDKKGYLPHIYHFDDCFGRKVSYFEIQTTSYGAIKTEDFEEFLAAQKMALDIVKILNKKFECNEAR